MRIKKVTAIAMAACLSVCLASPAFAADYKYTVEVSGGLHGDVSGKTPTEIEKDGQWNPNEYSVTAADGYYFKGFHISGQEGLVGATKITEDTTFVASYGIKGSETVSYTIHYEDEAGNTLAEDATYYGNINDKPVVAYRDIAGYIPRDTYNVTWTLTGDPNQEFTFVYIPDTATTTIPTTTEGSTTTGTTMTGTAGTTVGGTTAGTTGGNTGDAVTGTDTATGNAAGGPTDIIDLDENEVPLAGVEDTDVNNGEETAVTDNEESLDDSKTPLASLSTAKKAAIAIVVVVVIIALLIALALRAKGRKNDELE